MPTTSFMKKTGNFLFTLFLLPVCLSYNISSKNQDISRIETVSYQGANDSFYDGNDTVPRLVPFQKKPPPPRKSSTNFIQKLLSAFKFKKNAHANERVRIKAFIDSLRIDTNLVISIENIRRLDSVLNSSFTDLKTLSGKVASLTEEIRVKDSVYEWGINSSRKNFRVSQEELDMEMEKLAYRMKSIMDFNADENALKERNLRIAFIEKARRNSKNIDTISGSIEDAETKMKIPVTHRYHVRVRNRKEVYGIYDLSTLNHIAIHRFDQLDYLMLNSIRLDSNSITRIDQAAGKILAAEDYIKEALNRNCKIGLSFKIDSAANGFLIEMLKNTEKQNLFIRNALVLLSNLHAGAINIALDQLPSGAEIHFVKFIKRLSGILLIQSPSIKLLITVPTGSRETGFPLTALEEFTDRFIIDFSSNTESAFPIPLATLFGDQSFTIASTVSRFKSQQIPPEKIILQLPYRGTKWAFSRSFLATFLGYINYSQIRRAFEEGFDSYFKHYNPDSTLVILDSIIGDRSKTGKKNKQVDTLSDQQLPVIRILYDDEITLGKKFIYASDNLGGIALNALGNDEGYSNLWDELNYRMADTFHFYLPDSIGTRPPKVNLTWREKFTRYFTLFSYIVNNPCKTCFENTNDLTKYNRFQQYITDLRIDSILLAENKRLISQKEDIFRSHFEYVNYQLTNLLRTTTWVICLILLLLIIFRVLKSMYQGSEWKYKKVIGYLTILFSLLFVVSFFSFLFTSDVLPFFGSRTSNNKGISKDLAKAMKTDAEQLVNNDKTTISTKHYVNMIEEDNSYCEPDPSSDCINMPLHTLLLIVFICLAIGYAVTRFLVITVIKQKDIP